VLYVLIQFIYHSKLYYFKVRTLLQALLLQLQLRRHNRPYCSVQICQISLITSIKTVTPGCHGTLSMFIFFMSFTLFISYNILWLYILSVIPYPGYIVYQLQFTLARYFAIYSLLWLYILPVTTYPSCKFSQLQHTLAIYFASYTLL